MSEYDRALRLALTHRFRPDEPEITRMPLWKRLTRDMTIGARRAFNRRCGY